jgi:hypothetical protein
MSNKGIVVFRAKSSVELRNFTAYNYAIFKAYNYTGCPFFGGCCGSMQLSGIGQKFIGKLQCPCCFCNQTSNF